MAPPRYAMTSERDYWQVIVVRKEGRRVYRDSGLDAFSLGTAEYLTKHLRRKYPNATLELAPYAVVDGCEVGPVGGHSNRRWCGTHHAYVEAIGTGWDHHEYGKD